MKANTKYKKICNNISIYLRCLHQKYQFNCSKLVQRCPQYAASQHANKPIDSVVHDHRKNNLGFFKKTQFKIFQYQQ